ncbi:MAG: hypothetical protein Kow00124_21420 [Anaerolineae bacterium]
MAHDPYDISMSLLLDDLLDDEEKQQVLQQIRSAPDKAEAWERLGMVDAMLRSAPMEMPAPDFAARVMARVEAVEARRRWFPWLVALLVFLSIGAALTVAIPVLIIKLGLYQSLLGLPVVKATITSGAQVIAILAWAMRAVSSALGDWFTLLGQEPMALAVVIGALALASTWIGLREVQKTLVMAAASSHSS